MKAPAVVIQRQGLVPFTFDDLAGRADWRNRIHWPVAQPEMVAVGAKVPTAILDFAATLADPGERQVAIVAGGIFANGFMSLLEAAWACARAERLGLELAGGPPEMPLLAEGAERFEAMRYRGPFGVKPTPRAFLRGIARTASWTPAWRMPASLLAPEAIAISHNALLRRAAAHLRIGYRHAANFVLAARRTAASAPGDNSAIVEGVIDALLPLVPDLGSVHRERLRRALHARVGEAVGRVAADVAALRAIKLPKRIWSGTNGDYATRSVAAEMRRRGRTVDVFDHGGVTGISQVPGSTAIIELSTSSRFHVATPQWAALLKATEAPAIAARVNQAEIVGDTGEPTFRNAFRDRTDPVGRKPRVIYVGHPYRGLRQFPIAGLPDAIYWDFQIHLVETLLSLDIDLLCKPHPEGHFFRKPNPIEALATTSYRRFEEHLDDADVFVFDAPTSTTFLESLCTRRPVVLIDRFYALNPAVRPAIEARCRIVPVQADERNRLRVARDALAEAILGGVREADPTFFRRLVVEET